MEYCDRGSLDAAIRNGLFKKSVRWGERIALRSLLRTAREISQGLSHLHQHGVIHGEYVSCMHACGSLGGRGWYHATLKSLKSYKHSGHEHVTRVGMSTGGHGP